MKKYRVVEYDGRFWVQHRSWPFWLATEEPFGGQLVRVRRSTLDEAKEFIRVHSAATTETQVARVVYEYPERTQ